MRQGDVVVDKLSRDEALVYRWDETPEGEGMLLVRVDDGWEDDDTGDVYRLIDEAKRAYGRSRRAAPGRRIAKQPLRVEIPGYHGYFIVTGVKKGRGATGDDLWLAEGDQYVEGVSKPLSIRDYATGMLLANAVAKHWGTEANPLSRWGRKRAFQQKAKKRIEGATVTRARDAKASRNAQSNKEHTTMDRKRIARRLVRLARKIVASKITLKDLKRVEAGKTFATDDELEDLARDLNRVRNSRSAESALRDADEVLDGYGVEVIRDVDGEPVVWYVNMGDSYAPTVVWNDVEGEMFVSTTGDEVEELERAGYEIR